MLYSIILIVVIACCEFYSAAQSSAMIHDACYFCILQYKAREEARSLFIINLIARYVADELRISICGALASTCN
jgi:hypothetical protein